MAIRRSADELFMRRRWSWRSRAMGLASPNPCVGAIVVDELGPHRRARRPQVCRAQARRGDRHGSGRAAGARQHSLPQPGALLPHRAAPGLAPRPSSPPALGAWWPPCATPIRWLRGKGFEQLRAAGIEVGEGILEAEARKLNEAFARYIRTGVPFVTLKTAMTLDGNALRLASRWQAAARPSTTYIYGASALRQVHRLRHASDAIMVGIGTVIADDPLLTDRSGLARRRPLLRVILDSELRLPLDSRIVASAWCRPRRMTSSFSVAVHRRGNKRALESRGVRVEVVPPARRQFYARSAMRPEGAWESMQITSLLVEGGAKVNGAFLRAGWSTRSGSSTRPRYSGGGAPLASSEDGGASRGGPSARHHVAPLRRGFRRRGIPARSVRVDRQFFVGR